MFDTMDEYLEFRKFLNDDYRYNVVIDCKEFYKTAGVSKTQLIKCIRNNK
jgi:hypothetical protein